jgi:heme-degrading monooxygenase HmoA
MSAAAKPCTVMVLVRSTPQYQQELLNLSAEAVKYMKTLPGFIAHTLLKSQDGTLVISRIEWETLANHEACIANSNWTKMKQEWASYLDSGKATMDVHVLEAVQRVEAAAAR